MTTLVFTHKDWQAIRQRIDNDYGTVISLVSWKLRETLGFTVRHHIGFNVWNKRWDDDIRLDFVNQDSLTFFQLKYQ